MEQDKNNKWKAQVFAMTKQEVEKNPNIITGILLIVDFPAYKLFNSRATHSFISSSFKVKSSISCDKSKNMLEVSIPSSRVLNTNKIAKSV